MTQCQYLIKVAISYTSLSRKQRDQKVSSEEKLVQKGNVILDILQTSVMTNIFIVIIM